MKSEHENSVGFDRQTPLDGAIVQMSKVVPPVIQHPAKNILNQPKDGLLV